MKIKSGFSLRCVGNENIIVEIGKGTIDFSRVIILNDSSARLWTELTNKEFTTEDIARLLCQWYDVDENTAQKDAEELLEKWLQIGLIG